MRQTLCIIVLFAVTASTLSSAIGKDPILEKCKTEHKVTEELIEELHADPERLLRDPKTRCFAACVLTESKTFNSDGSLNVVDVIKYLPDNVARRDEVIVAFNDCANERGVDSCETAYKTAVCLNSKEVIRNMYPSE